jgi:hypothetical protein
MEKLEIKHLSPYLPYGLYWFCLDKDSREFETLGTVKIDLSKEEIEIGGMDIELSELPYPNGLVIKPILRPLSDLQNKDLDWWIEFGTKIDVLNTDYLIDAIVNGTYYAKNIHDSFVIWNALAELHFDIYGLIEKGLAIDINTLNQ